MEPTAVSILSTQQLPKPKKPAPVKQKAVPQVRQTLTSYKRMLRANPFLAKDINEFQKVTNLGLRTSTEFLDKFKQIGHSDTAPTQKSCSTGMKQPKVGVVMNKNSTKPSSKKPLTKNNLTKPTIKPDIPKSGQSTSKQVKFSKPTPSNPHLPIIKIQCIQEKTSKATETPLMDRYHSLECLNISKGDFENISPIANKEEQNKPFIFKTPTAYRRRSRSVDTPLSNKRTTLFRMSTPQPFNLQKLQDRLNKWLKSRGKPAALFHNLRTFTDPPYIEENKENMDTSQCENASFESLNVLETNGPAKPESDPKISNHKDRQQCIKEALRELQNLIEDEFPANQCYSWLQLIKETFPEVVNEPEYWECRAAVEQSMGNVHNAVEFYQKAIIHGAEVSNVDKSLNQLLKKFSLLNIDPDCAKNSAKVSKEKVLNEARHVFISTIINFAVYKRRDNKNETETDNKRYCVPVRRSTRLSRGAYVNTSGVQLCRSLKELDDAADISFHSNNAFC